MNLENLDKLGKLIWVLIYGGLLTLILSVVVHRTDSALGLAIGIPAALCAGLGFFLIYVRSRVKEKP
jgi:hypothetical protein